MRIHLVISRHGLPVTRILWTTTASSSGEYGFQRAASTSAIASSRIPNHAFGNGGYTVAQLLEDVNEVVPLETEPNIFDPERHGQWGLEDYVVEVGGSECLHFMEVDGLLREDDEVVIRALQLPDLRARRLCGRHQISSDGKHLIDGVAFGKPFFKRSVTSRPAISIPPRKKRRTVLSGWDHEAGYGNEQSLLDEEGDGDWQPPNDGFGKELSIVPAEHDMSMGTVIRHPVNYSAEDDSDEDDSDYEADELESELQALKEDFEKPPSHLIDPLNQSQGLGASLRSNPAVKRPASALGPRRSSLAGASSLSSKRSRGEDSSPRASKAVRFNKGWQHPQPKSEPQAQNATAQSSTDQSSDSSSGSDSDSSSDSESDSSSNSDSGSSEDIEVAKKSAVDTSDSDSDSDSDSSSNSSSSDDSSESEDETAAPRQSIVSAPGKGSLRTKKSNNRVKLRRRLLKLKELGLVHKDADFAALREWEEQNGGWNLPDEASFVSAVSKADKQEQEKQEFEAKRQELLRNLAAGGVDVEETSEKENMPPKQTTTANDAIENPSVSEEHSAETAESEKAARRQLDISSSRRLLFGSLGMRTPKTKEEEEAARRKLAAQASAVHSKKRKQPEPEPVVNQSDPSADDIDWESKLDIRAVECAFDDIELSAPPFPFQQRWDKEANALIRERKGWGKKRKRKQRIQVYDGDGEYDYYEDGNQYYDDDQYYGEASQLNYDEEPQGDGVEFEDVVEDEGQEVVNANNEDQPHDYSSLPGLLECESRAGAVIAFKQLDLSKETNWQPRMSEYKVAEVLGFNDGHLNVRLAIRDRRPKPDEDAEDDEPRQYSGFEMPGFDDEEDDGYRELAFTELTEPKLLRTAPVVIDSDGEAKEKGDAQGSNVSIVQDSMPNHVVDMDLDETTLATLATAVSHLDETPQSTRTHVPIDGFDDEQSDSLAIPSPSFSGFHSARSSPGTRIRIDRTDETNLDGHTLIGETHSGVAENSHDVSALSFLSANQSPEHDGQIADLPRLSVNAHSSMGSLISQVSNSSARPSSQARDPTTLSLPAVHTRLGHRNSPLFKATHSQSSAENSPRIHTHDHETQSHGLLGEPPTDYADQDDQDSVLHSGRQSTHIFSPHDSSSDDNYSSSHQSNSPSSSPSSRKPPTSAQHEPVSQASNVTGIKTESLPNSNLSRATPQKASQRKGSQASEVVDLTDDSVLSPAENPRSQESKAPGSSSKKASRQSLSKQPQMSSSKPQRLSQVVVESSPASSSKKKKRLSRKF